MKCVTFSTFDHAQKALTDNKFLSKIKHWYEPSEIVYKIFCLLDEIVHCDQSTIFPIVGNLTKLNKLENIC